MSVIKIKDVVEEIGLVGRALGRALAEKINAGDTLDFEGFLAVSNSFVDELVKVLLEKLGKDGFLNLKFINVDPLLRVLLIKSLKLRTSNLSVKHKIIEDLNAKHSQIQGKSIFPFSV
ncbi:MAG: hypothetical protein ABWJ99_00750 [Caldimicrobium sp.]